MKHKQNLFKIIFIAFSLSIITFIIDLGDYYPSVIQNIIDVFIMTFIFFLTGVFGYTIFLVLSRLKKVF